MIQRELSGIDVEVDTQNIKSCHCLEDKGNERKVKQLSKRKDADKIRSNKKKTKNIKHKTQ